MVKPYILSLIFCVSAILSAGAATPDTLADLNGMLGGIKNIQISKEKPIPAGFTVAPDGWVTSDTSLLTNKVYVFEVLAQTPEEETFIVAFRYDNRSSVPKVTVIADKIEMATGLRKDGMIWVVVTVSMVVFAVLIGYLVLLDRKVRKIEKA
ncbi:MAG: CcmD family protein [Flavobacteriales bacterium]